jgi:hypothetical protein
MTGHNETRDLGQGREQDVAVSDKFLHYNWIQRTAESVPELVSVLLRPWFRRRSALVVRQYWQRCADAGVGR